MGLATAPNPMTSLQTETLHIDGMTCSHCVRAVIEALESVPEAQVHLVTVGSVNVSFPADQRTKLARAIESAGYRVRPQ